MNSLRPLRPDDVRLLFTWRTLPEVARYMYSEGPRDLAAHEAWFERALIDASRQYWIIRCGEADVGLVNLYAIDPTHGTAAWAFYLASEDVRGKGVGSFVEFAMLEESFERRALGKLWCEVLASNATVIEMHERFGFRREGLFRHQIRRDGKPLDVVRLGMLAAEWQALRPGLEARLGAKGVLAR